MKLKLEINGEIKEFKTKKMRGRAFKQMLEVQDSIVKAGDNFGPEQYDLVAVFICEMFDNAFDEDELLDGIDLAEILPTYRKICEDIGQKTASKMEKIVKN